ncbi:hypothetical protein LAZ67_5002115 [Cordylochernes scorpioides]|uniref:Endonuclease-reverse transcriptase n=1 Tax=Cordylochernes scorpioides TaxID=51811 RepID=A0ABY6KH79_9ARAC|nr:hypothetical protein LAZ67_5002115 [Cordylochernes scorpioides]
MAAEIKSLGERIDIRLTKIETRMDAWDMRFCNMEEKLTKCIESQQATEKLASCNSLKVNELEARVEFFETRLREPNLVFYGIEKEGDENQADCNLKIQNIIRDKMEIGDDLKITKCHRLSRGSNAPVLVVVPDYADRAKIFKNAYKLRDTKISISKDYSKNVREQRRILIAKRKELGKRKYLSLLKYKKNKYSDSVQAALSNVRDSAEFWKIIASFKKRNSTKGNIDISEWESFYQGLLSPPQRIVADIPTLLIPIDSELDAEISPLEM